MAIRSVRGGWVRCSGQGGRGSSGPLRGADAGGAVVGGGGTGHRGRRRRPAAGGDACGAFEAGLEVRLQVGHVLDADGEPDQVVIAEDKRRRNTAASGE